MRPRWRGATGRLLIWVNGKCKSFKNDGLMPMKTSISESVLAMTSWIANLPLRHKLLLLCLVGLVLAAAPSIVLVKDLVSSMQVIRQERDAMPSVHAMLKMVRYTQEHRGMSTAVLNGNETMRGGREQRQTLIEQALTDTRSLLQAQSHTRVMSELDSIQQEWRTLAKDVSSASVSASDSVTRHNNLINRMLFLLDDEAEVSGLSLDADAESYYLILTVMRDLPRVTDKMGQARARGTALVHKRSTDALEVNALQNAFGAVRVHAIDARRNLEKASARSVDAGASFKASWDDAHAAMTAAEKLVNRISAGQFDTLTADAYFKEMTTHIDQLYTFSDVLLSRLDHLFEARSAAERNALVGVLAAMLVALLAGIALVVVIARSITGPIGRALEMAEAMAQGDLSHELAVDQRDEIGVMVHAMAESIQHMRQTLAGIKSTSESVATAATQIAQGNLDLSSRTENQASSLQQTASSMEEMSATVNQNAHTAATANSLANQAASVASESGETFSQVVHKMEAIKQSSNKIAEINAVIDGIAFQTNILALNAAVEAARAGEQGRGFAVVASEVRALAQRSANAAREIKSLISHSVENVEAGYALAQSTGQSIDRLVAQVQRVSQMMSEIATSSDQQSQGIAQVNAAVTQLDEVTQQNAALVEESSAAATSLREQAQRLQEAVGVFKVD